MTESDAIISLPPLRRERDMLAKSTPLPARIHLAHTLHTPAAQRAEARFDAVFFGVLALFPALMVSAVMKNFRAERETLIYTMVAIMLGTALRTYYKISRDRTRAFEQTKWLDFTDRSWRSRKEYAHASMPAESLRIPFTSLVLVCSNISIEEHINFCAELCQFSDMGKHCTYTSECAHQLFVSSDEDAVHDYARKLAALWSIDCWHYAPLSEGGLQRIFKAPATVPLVVE